MINSYSLTDNFDDTYTPTPQGFYSFSQAGATGDMHFVPSGSFANDLMYTNWTDGTVSIIDIDPATGLVKLPLQRTLLVSGLGGGPWGLDFDPITRNLFIANWGGNPFNGVVQIGELAVAYGTGVPGWLNNTPNIIGAGEIPRTGSTDFRIELSNALAGAPCMIAVSFVRAEFPIAGMTLYGDFLTPGAFFTWSLVTDGFPGITLGKATLPIPIPNDASLVGLKTYWQGFVMDPASPLPIGVSHTGGLEVTVVR